jgi:Nucleotidyl transferase AbiEii toxin, Type IV TA system
VNEVLQAASELQAVCQAEHWKFCFIGGLAVLRWGEPRETVDVDLSLLTGFGAEDPYIQTLLRHFDSRIEDAGEFARQNRVLLLRSRSGVGLDIALAGLMFEELMIKRSSYFDYSPHISLFTCSAEDLIVLKTFAGRGQDWVDVERIIVRQTGRLDWNHVEEQLGPLLEIKGETEVLTRLQELRFQLENSN